MRPHADVHGGVAILRLDMGHGPMATRAVAIRRTGHEDGVVVVALHPLGEAVAMLLCYWAVILAFRRGTLQASG